MTEALAGKRYFKLILGASFTDLALIERLLRVYLPAGIDCIDIAADSRLVTAVDALLGQQEAETGQPAPTLKVSVPLEADPHFRKIALDTDACIVCGICVPECPVEALAIPDPAVMLDIDQPRCYGCGRCVPICPVDALAMAPFEVDWAALAHPRVEAIELHTRHADIALLERFLTEAGPEALQGKLISLCYSPQDVAMADNADFLADAHRLLAPLSDTARPMLQIDGKPMSGSEEPEASRPALEAAKTLCEALPWVAERFWITISGGINAQTAVLLTDYPMVHGAAMGTMAKRQVWPWLEAGDHARASAEAQGLVARFLMRNKST